MPLLSVCMATHNGERFIRQQLESILSQLGLEDEVVISDDSSTDGTIGIIKNFGDKRIRLFEKNNFSSPIFNFENALKKARGDIIILSDQDDIWLGNKVAVIRDAFCHKQDTIYLIAMDGYIIDENDHVIYESIFKKINAGRGILKNVYDNTYLGCCLAFSKGLLEIALPFPKQIPMHDMWLGLLGDLVGQVNFIAEKTIRYRKHSASLTDFRRRFIPITQIKRRLFLSYNLVKRWLRFKFSGTKSGETTSAE